MDECLICKKHYTQGGTCCANKKNCLLFEEEPGGKMIRGTFCIEMDMNAVTAVIKPHSSVSLTDKNGRNFKALVVKINWVNMRNFIMSIDADYHEIDMPLCEKKKKLFKLLT